MLQVSDESLIYYLYRMGLKDRYISFQIPKKVGGTREISAPNSHLKGVQKELGNLLNSNFQPYPVTHGFVLEKSVLSNAKIHLGSKWVLNIDLKDFFSAINFGRVYGLFLKPPYNCPKQVATVLAQICCHENKLPQGAPSSPVISNLICKRLDRNLRDFAQKNRCRYSRYADDITISSRERYFPKVVARLNHDESSEEVVKIGKELLQIVEKNGFEINQKKTRLRNLSQRLEVTGLTINEKPNTTRTYVRQIRAMLHAWKKFGLEQAEAEYHRKYCPVSLNPKKPLPQYRNVVNGKLNYLRMIRGVDDTVYRRLRHKFESLDPKFNGIREHNRKQRLYQSTWVVMSEDQMHQGTGFWLKDYGFITCAHVLDISQQFYVFNTLSDGEKYPATVKSISYDKDIAILGIDGVTPEFQLSLSPRSIVQGDAVLVAGFPSYDKVNGYLIYIAEGKATQKIKEPKTKNTLWRIDAQISAGNSGGPVLGQNHQVVGIACRGSESLDLGNATPIFGVLPLDVGFLADISKR